MSAYTCRAEGSELVLEAEFIQLVRYFVISYIVRRAADNVHNCGTGYRLSTFVTLLDSDHSMRNRHCKHAMNKGVRRLHWSLKKPARVRTVPFEIWLVARLHV